MGVTETRTRGVRVLVERPTLLLVGLVGLYLLADLIAKMAEVSFALAGVQVFGGNVAVSQVATYLLDGLVIGLVVGLAGVGLSMTYSILNFANFAHGDYITVGAFSGWTAAYVVAGIGTAIPFGQLVMLNTSSLVSVTKTPLAVLVGFGVAAAATVGVALLLDRLVYEPMRDKGGITLLIASIGVALALRYTVVYVYQTNIRALTATDAIPSMRIAVVDGVLNVDFHEVVLGVVAVALMVGVHFLLQRTKLGKAMRAMADNKDLAQVTGIPTERVVRATWIIGGALAGLAGFLIVLERGTLLYSLGWRLLLLIFAGVILGGIGSVYGAIGGGIVIGLASRLSLVWIPSDFARAAAFAVMILVLLYRPEGLFGGVKTA